MNVRFAVFAICIVLFIASCEKKKDETVHEHKAPTAEAVPADTVKKSVPKEVHAQVAGVHIMIKYHAPAVRGRTIWGGLVPYGDVWVTGAHSATSIEIDKPITVKGTEIPAGKYALFTIPDKEIWTIIINKKWDQHLADDYNQAEDVVRITTKPEILESVQERLKYSVGSGENSAGTIQIRWEKLNVTLPFNVK